jgi:ABC-type sulfate/molybdate transport systems ATPase subunit
LGYPPLWLLDEPASALDDEGLHRLQEWLSAHLATGGLVILSAHRQEEILRLAERFLHLKNGQVVEQGSLYAQEPS